MKDFKIGDKVIIRKANVVNDNYRFGIVTKIKYDSDPNYSFSIYYYRVEQIKSCTDFDDDRYTSCNVFPNGGDEIELDTATIRQDKLNQLC